MRSLTGFNSEFSFWTSCHPKPSLPNHFTQSWREDSWIHTFPKCISTRRNTNSFVQVWTRVAVSISYDNIHYPTSASIVSEWYCGANTYGIKSARYRKKHVDRDQHPFHWSTCNNMRAWSWTLDLTKVTKYKWWQRLSMSSTRSKCWGGMFCDSIRIPKTRNVSQGVSSAAQSNVPFIPSLTSINYLIWYIPLIYRNKTC